MTCPALPSRGEDKAESVLEHYNSLSVQHRARPRQTCRNYGRMKLKMWEVQFNHGGVSGPGWLLPSCILSWVVQEDEKEPGKKVSPPSPPAHGPLGALPALPVLSASFILTAQKGWPASSSACREPSS